MNTGLLPWQLAKNNNLLWNYIEESHLCVAAPNRPDSVPQWVQDIDSLGIVSIIIGNIGFTDR